MTDFRGEMERPPESDHLSVVWTRGKGCAELSELLDEAPQRIGGGDLTAECIDHRADLLVARKLPPGSFDLVNVAVPIDFQPGKVTRVVAAVGGGPHSLLAAAVAARLGRSLGVPAEMVSASVPDDERAASAVLAEIGSSVPDISGRVVEVESVERLLEGLDEGTLVVLGASGGSWLRRMLFGPGARLRRTAQTGVVVVRSAPDRVFRFMGEPVYVAPLREATDTLRFHDQRILAVADEGRLVGVVRREKLIGAGSTPVGSLMEEALFVRVDGTIEEAYELEPDFGTDPIPVTDHEENLVGGLSLPVG
jgi:CBS domain-containing protein